MISLIISFYKRLDFLELILQALDKQSYKKFEVLIAEDNNDPETVSFVDKARVRHGFEIKHLSQDDNGFRKTRILNSAVIASQGEKCVFIDGDCIPHRHFLKEYEKAINDTHFCYGRRVFCSQKHTLQLLESRDPSRCNNLLALLYGGKSIGAGFYLPWKINSDKQHRRILGCNWGILKKNILAVNGFDEDYNRAGVGEDFDIDWRLKKNGLKVRSMKGKAIVFHLHHAANYSQAETDYVEKMMADKKLAGKVFCDCGISGHNAKN
jgi:cellulose synthase/poly-beta-1,6-N-acetylglucosamine synthase-like glycosyltransferase